MFNQLFQFGVKLFVFSLLPVVASAAVRARQLAPTLWEHNGSTVYLVAKGSTRQFFYEEPREGITEQGVHRGTLLFTGTSRNGRYSGTAYIFRRGCGSFPYRVSGPILDNYNRVVMQGRAPRIGSNCRIVGYTTDTLEFALVNALGDDKVAADGSGTALTPSMKSHSPSQWDEPWCHTGSCVQSYIRDVQQIDNCKKRFRFATRSISQPDTEEVTSQDFENAPIEISDWSVADCCESTIDGELVPAIARSTAELFAPENLLKVCRTR